MALVSMATTLTATDSPMLATATDTIMARGPLTPMPGDTDTAAHTDTDTDTGTDTLMASKLPPNLVACHRTPMSSKYLSFLLIDYYYYSSYHNPKALQYVWTQIV